MSCIDVMHELAIHGCRHCSGLLGDDYCYCIGDFGNADCRTVTKTEFLGNIDIARHGQNTLRSQNAASAHYHSSVVQRRVLEKDSFYKALVDVGINRLTGRGDLGQRCRALNDNKGSHLLLRHIHARHHYRHDCHIAVAGTLVL